jgi:hypothetical protein
MHSLPGLGGFRLSLCCTITTYENQNPSHCGMALFFQRYSRETAGAARELYAELAAQIAPWFREQASARQK